MHKIKLSGKLKQATSTPEHVELGQFEWFVCCAEVWKNSLLEILGSI